MEKQRKNKEKEPQKTDSQEECTMVIPPSEKSDLPAAGLDPYPNVSCCGK
jgi:hypothetical protein